MSLLMDALKKAEQDKKKAAEDLQANLAAGARVAGAGTHDEPSLEFPGAGAEPAGDTRQSERIPAGEASDFTLAGDPMDLSRDRSLPLSGSSPSISRGVPPPAYDKEGTLPSQRAINASLKDYFDSSQSLDRSRPEPGLSTSGSFGTGDTIARVSADTVFTATQRTPITSSVGLGLVVIIVLSVSLGALWFWGEIEQGSAGPDGNTFNPAQTVMSASGPERQAPAAGAAVSTPTRVSDSANLPPTPTEEASGGLAEPAQERDPRPQATPAGSQELLARSATAPSEQQPEPPAIRAGLPASVAGMVAEPSAIKITKSRRRDLVDPDTTDAYRAYQRGDYRRAERLYRTVLSRHPEQRDALLGIAAVAARHGQTEQAQRYYGRLLQINPRDSVAHAALSGLQGEAGRDLSESKLKLLLDDTPHAGQLHFSLGNLYARQGRWAEAQEAYFKAFGAESQNPDYVFNLAVSLDRMGQAKPAVGYYRQALVLADRRSVNFNTSQVLSRIRTLSHPPSSD